MNNLQLYRKKAQLTQQELSKATNIPQTTISCWERKIGEPTVTQAFRLADILDTTVEDLFGSPQHQLRYPKILLTK